MKPLWVDTDADTEREMLRLLREASVERRFGLMDALTTSVVTLSRRALAASGRELERELREFYRKRGG